MGEWRESPPRSGPAVLPFALYALSVSAIEIGAYQFGGLFAVVASRAWLVCGAVFLTCSLARIWSTFRRDFSERFFWGFAVTLAVAGVTFWKIGSFEYFINGEAAHQVYNGLCHWMERDLHYTGCGFFCYPSRQYLLAALPSVLFGRNLSSLRLSYLWLFFLGMLLFYVGLRQRLRSAPNGGCLAAVAELSILSFPYVVLFLRGPEQSLMPLALTLAATGWYLVSLAEPGPLSALCLSWIGALLATSYTPGLAGWSLVIGMLLLTMAARLKEGRKREASLLFLAAVIVISFGVSSFLTRGDIELRIYQERRGSFGDILRQIRGGYFVFFLPGQRLEDHVFMNPLWLLPLSLYLITSLLWSNGAAHFLISLWAIGVIAASVYLQGYAVAGPAHDIHKAMVALPPLVAGTIIKVGTFVEKVRLSLRMEALALFLLLAVSVGWNLSHSHSAYHDVINRRQHEVLQWSLTVAQEMALVDSPIDMYVFSSADFTMEDYWRYFFPRFGAVVVDKEKCLQKFTATRASMILYDGSACEGPLQELLRMHDGFHELPGKHGLKGLVFIPKGEPARPSARLPAARSGGTGRETTRARE